jgi:tetratricopeptide (TPR) repeat protein
MNFALILIAAQSGHVERRDPYEVRTDAPPEIARKVAGWLQTAHLAYRKLVPHPAPKGKDPWRVRVFATREGAEAYFGTLGAKPPGGFAYLHADREIVAWVLPDVSMRRRIVHEGFHQYFRSVIEHPPEWLNEGIGEMLEYSEFDRDGGVKPGPHPVWIQWWREGIRGLDENAGSPKGELLPLRELIGSEWRGSAVQYTEEWGLCYRLRREGGLKDCLRALDPAASAAANARLAAPVVDDRAFREFFDGLEAPGRARFQEGRRLFGLGRYGDALPELTAALEAAPEHKRYLYYRGACAWEAGRFEQAEKDLLALVALAPKDAGSHLLLGMAQAGLRKKAEARRSFERAAELDPKLREEAARRIESLGN